VAHKPVGGIAFKPFLTEATSASMPFSMRGAQAVASPVIGAPAAPDAWHITQDWLYFSMLGSAITGPVTAKATNSEAGTSARRKFERDIIVFPSIDEPNAHR
jgi:hypothetical protein